MTPEEFGQALQDIKIEQARANEQLKTLFRMAEEQKALTQSVQDLALAVKELTGCVTGVSKDVDGVRKDVDDMKSKPGKRWDTLQASITAALVSGVIGFVLAKVLH